MPQKSGGNNRFSAKRKTEVILSSPHVPGSTYFVHAPKSDAAVNHLNFL